MLDNRHKWERVDHSGLDIMLVLSKAYKERIPMCLLFSMGSSTYTQAVKRNRLGSVDLGTTDPSAAQRSLSACRQQPCQLSDQKPCQVCRVSPHGKTRAKSERSFGWGQLTPGMSQSVRGQENIKLTCTVTMREHYIKTSIQSPELTMSLMEIDSRTQIYNHYNRLDTMYSSVRHNYRRTLRKWT